MAWLYSSVIIKEMGARYKTNNFFYRSSMGFEYDKMMEFKK